MLLFSILFSGLPTFVLEGLLYPNPTADGFVIRHWTDEVLGDIETVGMPFAYQTWAMGNPT